MLVYQRVLYAKHDDFCRLGVSGGAFGGYTQSNVAARRVVPSEATKGGGGVIEAWD